MDDLLRSGLEDKTEEGKPANNYPFGFTSAEEAATKTDFEGVQAFLKDFPTLPKEPTDYYAECLKKCEEEQKERDEICKNIVLRAKQFLKQNGCNAKVVPCKKKRRKKCAPKRKTCAPKKKSKCSGGACTR